MKEVVFPAKVSGFYNRKDGAPSLLPIEEIKNALAVLDSLGITWKLLDFSSLSSYSYHCCYFEWEGASYFFFMNKYHHLGAFSKIEDAEAWRSWKLGELLPRNHYCNLPKCADTLSTFWTVVPEEMLIQKVDADNEISQKIVMQLQNAEFGEFSYWEPQNMGNILFNNWEK